VFDMVKVIRVPCMAQQRIEDVREELIDESIFLIQDSSNMNMLVLQKSICSGIPALHDAMDDRVPPVETVEHVNGRR
jgi:hypothetical protein